MDCVCMCMCVGEGEKRAVDKWSDPQTSCREENNFIGNVSHLKRWLFDHFSLGFCSALPVVFAYWALPAFSSLCPNHLLPPLTQNFSSLLPRHVLFKLVLCFCFLVCCFMLSCLLMHYFCFPRSNFIHLLLFFANT